MNHWRNLIEGASRVLILGDDRDYIRPKGGFLRDAEMLRQDGRRVAKELQHAVRRHDEQAYNCKG